MGLSLTTKLVPRLHVGGSWRKHPPDKGWDVVLTVCTAAEVYGTPPARHHASLPMLDVGWVNVPAVEVAREAVAEYVRAGAKTLVRCHAGLNRSALVAVLAAADVTGADPGDLVAHLRSRRAPEVLNNEAFEEYVLR